MDSKKLKKSLEWAFEHEDVDSMATAYVGICHAIGSISDEPVCLSKLVKSKIGEDEHPMDSELCKADLKLDELVDNLYQVRNELCLIINKIIKI